MDQEQLEEETREFIDLLLEDYVAVKPNAPLSAEPVLAYGDWKKRIRPYWEFPGYLEYRLAGITFKVGTDDPELVVQFVFDSDPGYTYGSDEYCGPFKVEPAPMTALIRGRREILKNLMDYLAMATFKIIEANSISKCPSSTT